MIIDCETTFISLQWVTGDDVVMTMAITVINCVTVNCKLHQRNLQCTMYNAECWAANCWLVDYGALCVMSCRMKSLKRRRRRRRAARLLFVMTVISAFGCAHRSRASPSDGPRCRRSCAASRPVAKSRFTV